MNKTIRRPGAGRGTLLKWDSGIRLNDGRLVVGLTGGYGSGKSMVSAIFQKMGATIESADELAHRALRPGTPTYKRIMRAFGPDIQSRSGALDRARLAGIVFNDPSARRRLEKIVHPFVIAQHKKTISRHKRGILVLEIPLLFEAGLRKLVDKVVVVSAPAAIRMRRLAKKGVAPADFRRRSRAQWPLARKVRLADAVIDNGGSPSAVRKQAQALLFHWGIKK